MKRKSVVVLMFLVLAVMLSLPAFAAEDRTVNGKVGQPTGAIFPFPSMETTDLLLVGGGLPPGMIYSTTSGHLAGIPTEAGTWSYTLQAVFTDFSREDLGTVTIIIEPADSRTFTLKVGESFRTSFPLSVGAEGVLLIGDLPPGMVYTSSTGILEGTPEAAGTWTYKLEEVYPGVQNWNMGSVTLIIEPADDTDPDPGDGNGTDDEEKTPVAPGVPISGF